MACGSAKLVTGMVMDQTLEISADGLGIDRYARAETRRHGVHAGWATA